MDGFYIQEFVILDKNNYDAFVGEAMSDPTMPIDASQNVDSHSSSDTIHLSLTTSNIDRTFSSTDYSSASLGNWLSRPRVIISQTWAVGTHFNNMFFPWAQFLDGLTAGPLQSRLNNFFLLRGTMHLKFLVNGSMFHSGLARATFTPCEIPNLIPAGPTEIPTTPLTLDNYGTANDDFPPLLTLYSQKQGIYIDPSTNQVNTLQLPFFFPKNYIDLRLTRDLDNLGYITLYSQNILRQSNGGTDDATITVLAHMENIELTTPTVVDVFQGEAASEYGNGIISTPATAVSRFASYLTAIPYIGKFAMATQIASSAISNMASLWGFSRPIVLDPAMAMRPRLMGNIANTLGEETIPKLSLDPKQELSVDPSTVGIDGMDQMSIAYIASKESLISIIPWNVVDSPGTRLCAIKVHPMVYPRATQTIGSAVTAHFPTALAFVTKPFLHWRGSLHYRVQIVASQNHRGRLMIQYDPQNLSAADAPNTQIRYTEILDLALCRDMTFSVNYNRPEPYLETDWNYSSTADVTFDPDGTSSGENKKFSNGTLIFSVLNELVSPANTGVIEVNVYVRAGNDYSVANPFSGELNKFSYNETYTDAFWGEAMSGKVDPTTECQNMPCQYKYHVINGSSEGGTEDNIKKVMFGEQIVSIRSLMKRYNLTDVVKSLTAEPSAISEALIIDRPNMPNGPGVAYGNSTPTTIVPTSLLPYNYCKMNYIRYFMQAYIGYRGAVRWKAICMGGDVNAIQTVHRDVRFKNATDRCTATIAVTELAATESAALVAFQFANIVEDCGSKDGSEVAFVAANRCIEYELPYQSPNRFAYCTNALTATASSVEDGWLQEYQRHNHRVITFNNFSVATRNNILYSYTAIGDDFSFFWYNSAPILYSRLIPTPPS